MAEQNLSASSTFLKEFTFALIKAIEKRKLNIRDTKVIVDADLIPELSDELMKEYLRNKELLRRLEELDEMDFLEPEPLVPKPLSRSQQKVVSSLFVAPQQNNMRSQQKTRPSQPLIDNSIQNHQEGNGYDKIRPMLEDFSVSRIQCISPFKPLVIIHSGQKQVTKIGLSQKEIYDVFLYFAEMAHLPLIDGPIKILLNDMEINGINSKLTESKFIIQKKTAYSLLERPGSSGNLGIPMRTR